MAQMKEQNKTPEKELNEMEISNLSDAEFQTLVIRMLKELIVYGNNIKEEVRVTLGEMKNLHGTNSEGEEARIQVSDLVHKEEISVQPEQQEETRIKKKNPKKPKPHTEDNIRSLWDISKCTTPKL